MKEKRKISEETREKLRISHLGKKITESQKQKIRKIALERGFGKWMLGRKHSNEVRLKISKAHKGKKNTLIHNMNISKGKKGKANLNLRGSKHHHWKGGVTPINKMIRSSLEYKIWRDAVFKRDNFTCVWCGICGNETGGYLHADHIKPFAVYPELRFALDNGRTLCVPCHRTTDTFAGRNQKRK